MFESCGSNVHVLNHYYIHDVGIPSLGLIVIMSGIYRETFKFIETKTDGLWRPKLNHELNPGQTGELTETEDRNRG